VAEGCAALRDNLWQLVDGKVATAIAVDDRRLAERPAWLAAAQTVTTGVGDRSIADEVIRQQINPYVDNDIRIDWLSVMRSTVASVDASFDAVTDGLAALPAECFEVVGDLGPRAPAATAPVVSPPLVGFDAVPTVPAAAPPPPPPPMLTPPPTPPTTPAEALDSLPPALPPPTAPLGDATGLPGGMGDLGGAGGLGGLAGNIGGVVGSIIDGIGGLLGSLVGGLADSGPDDSAFEDPFDADVQPDEADDIVDDRSDEKDPDPADADDEDTAAPD